MTKNKKTIFAFFKETAFILTLITVIFSCGKVCNIVETNKNRINISITKEQFQEHINENEKQSKEVKIEIGKLELKLDKIDDKISDIYKMMYNERSAILITREKKENNNE